jgi:hypothetical protein
LSQSEVEDDWVVIGGDFIIMAHGSAAAAGETNGVSAAAKNASSSTIAVHRFQIAFFIAAPEYLRKVLLETLYRSPIATNQSEPISIFGE